MNDKYIIEITVTNPIYATIYKNNEYIISFHRDNLIDLVRDIKDYLYTRRITEIIKKYIEGELK